MSVRAVSLRTLSHVSLADAFRSAACYLPNTSAGGGWKPARVPTGSLPPPTFQVRVPPPNARVRVPPSHCGPATHWHRHGCHADDDHPIARKIGVLDGLKLEEGTCFASNLRFYQSKASFLLDLPICEEKGCDPRGARGQDLPAGREQSPGAPLRAGRREKGCGRERDRERATALALTNSAASNHGTRSGPGGERKPDRSDLGFAGVARRVC
jgi:hypothetical protein